MAGSSAALCASWSIQASNKASEAHEKQTVEQGLPPAAMLIQGVTSHLSQWLVRPSGSSQHTNSCTTWSQMGQSASKDPATATLQCYNPLT